MTAREILMEDLHAELKSVREQMDIVTSKFKDAKISSSEFAHLLLLLNTQRDGVHSKLARLLADGQ